ELSECTFDRDLPKRGYAHRDFVVGSRDLFPHPHGETGRFVAPPDKGVRVEKEPQSGASNSSAISSSVNSKSGEIQIVPLPRPGTRGLRSFGTGTRRTSGWPLRAMTTSSPARARATRRDSEVFAWCILTSSAISTTLARLAKIICRRPFRC